jgi:hypothetical protein
MATPKKISELTTAGALTGAELVPVVQNGGTLQTTTADLKIFSLGTVEYQVSTLNLRVDAVSALATQTAEAVVSINAEVSLKANRTGDYLANVQYIEFNTTTGFTPSAGHLTWDTAAGTLDLGLTGTVNLLVGQRTVCQLYNNSGVTLSKGKAVRVTGAQGQRLTAALAQADSDADSLTVFGVMLETVSVNKSGYAATDGLVRSFDTGAFADGDILWLSPITAGELTPTKPVAPQHLVQMGYVVKGNSVGAGEIYIKVQNGYELGELHDVKVSASASLTNGEMLSYNTSAGVWTNTSQLRVDNANVVVGTGAIATGATSGFLWVAGCAGVPTGIPTTYTGRVPVVVDTTNHRLYFYSGGSWRNAGP